MTTHIYKEDPSRTSYWGWMREIDENPKNVVKILPSIIADMKTTKLNGMLEHGVVKPFRHKYSYYDHTAKRQYWKKIQHIIFAEYEKRDARLTVPLQALTDYILQYNLKWDHFTNVDGIVKLYYAYKQRGDAENAAKLMTMIFDFKPAQVRKLMKTWPHFVEYAEMAKFHEKIDAIVILSVYFRNPHLRKFLTKDYYLLLKQDNFFQSLEQDRKRTYREIKFFDNEFKTWDE